MIASVWRAARAFLPVSAILALATSAPTAFAQTNLLQNGSFESSSIVPSANGQLGTSDASIPGWTWTAASDAGTGSFGSKAFVAKAPASYETPQDGTYGIIFGGGTYSSGGSLAQSFFVTTGAHCSGSFWIERIGAGEAVTAVARITDNLNGGAVVATIPVTFPAASDQWQKISFTFTAPSNSLTFTFSDTTANGAAGSTDIGFDNVSITQKTLQTITFYGGVGNAGDIAANTEYSNDGDVTWHPAYLSGSHPWGFLPGTNSWINQDPSPFVGLYQTTDFRIKFNLPPEFEDGSMSFAVNADNHGELSINSTVLSSTDGGTNPSLITANGASLLPGQVNVLKIRLTDFGGWVGINYVLTLTGYAYSAPTIVVLPPVITNALGASGTVGVPFSFPLTGGNSPTSFNAGNLPPGLSINPSTGLISGTPTTYGTFATTISETNSGGTSTGTLTISINKGAATVTLGGLAQVYDGTVKSATATTNPGNLTVSFSYTGAALPPVNAGLYGVLGVISNSNYNGSANGTLTISPAALTITLGNLTQTYTGGALGASLATTPANIATSVTYNGGSSLPVNVGSYAVSAASANPNYAGTKTGTLTITPAALAIAFGNLAQIYNGGTHPVTVATTPTGVATGPVTYAGSTTAPTNAGSYLVATASANPNYAGSATATLTIAPQPTTIAIGNMVQPYDGTPKRVTTATSPTANVPVTVTYNGSTTAPSAIGNYTVHAATNDANFAGAATATLQIKDTLPPVITGPGNVTFEATMAAGAVATFSASATDNVDGTDAVTFSPASGTTFPLGTTTVTATARDTAGNPGTATFPVTVVDTTAPTITGATRATESFAAYSGIQDALQYQSGLKVAYGGAIAGWSSSGFHAVHAVDRSGSGDWAIMVYNDNVITQSAGVAANSAGSNYVVAFLASPAVYGSTNETTSASDGLVVDVLRADGSVLASATAQPGVWAGNLSFSGYHFVYTGDGSGPVRLRVRSLVPNDGRFGGAIDDITIADATPADVSLEATSASGAVADFNPVAIDRVSGYTAVTASPASGSTFAIGTTPVTLHTTDSAGNAATATFNVVVKDTTAPTISAPADRIVEATSADGANVTFSASASDLVDGPVAVTASVASGSTFPLGATPVTLTATDAHGNRATATFTVTVRDTTAPTLALPANQVLEATGSTGAVATYAATATDAVTASPTIGYSVAPGSAFPIGTTVVNVTAADQAGNTANGTVAITVRDTTPPVITGPGDQTAEATSAAGAVVTFPASAGDLVDGAVAVVAIPASGSTFALGHTTVSLSSIDAHGNTSAATFVVTVQDTTAPTLTVPANQILEATGPNGAVATYAASASDAVTASPAIAYSIASGSTFPIGTTTVGVTAADAAGNHSNGSFTVTVRDTTAPVINAPANQVIEATGPNGAVANFTASATDIVDGEVAVTSDIASGSTFAIGTTPVTLTSTDAHGNTSHAVFTITVQDTAAPVIAAQDNLIAEATGADGAAVAFTPSATDIVSGAVAVAASPKSGGVFPIGTTTVTLAASDAAGNTATGSFTVTVRDTTAPAITGPGNLVAEATSAAGAAVNFNASATDIVDGAVAVSAVPASGSTFALGATTVTLTATDAHGNAAHSTFTVTVQDTTAPALTVPSNQVIEATGPNGAIATFAARATDAVTASPVIGYSQAPGTVFPLGTTTVNVTATDAAGNGAKGSFTVTVVDTIAPALTMPANQTVEATTARGAVATFTASATDAVTASPAIAYSVAPGTRFALGTTTVQVTATDGAGNTSRGSFTITVRDTTAPNLTVPANLTLEASSATGAVANFAASATDTVTSAPAIAYSAAPGSRFAIGTTTVTVTATDAAGNVAKGSFTVTVRDTTPPTIGSVSASPNSIWPPNKKMVPVTIAVHSTDIVGVTSAKIVSVTTNEPDGTTQWVITGDLTLTVKSDRLGKGDGRVYTITIEVRDAAGNTTRKNVTVSVPHDQGN